MKFLEVSGLDDNFVCLCHKLEDYQYKLIPILKEKGYKLTNDLDEVVGYVLFVDGKPIGEAGLKRLTQDTCEFVHVFIEESHRGKGYATLLLGKVESLAKRLGYANATLSVWQNAESALKLYKKLGFVCGEEKTSAYYGNFKYFDMTKQI